MLKKGGKVKLKKGELHKISLNVNEDGDVLIIRCKICKEYYVDNEGREELKKFTGKVKELVVEWTNRSHIIKINNSQEHIQKTTYHADAIRRMKERADANNWN